MLLPRTIPVESTPFPYSIQTDPSPIVTESAPLVPLGPVAKTEETAVGSAWADATVARRRAVVDKL
jgi:hypothetical protein